MPIYSIKTLKESTVEWHSVIEFKALVVCLIPIDLYTFVVFLNYVEQVSLFKVNVKVMFSLI